MAKQLETITITSPGFFGVNTQDPWKIDPNYCLVADNCIIDKMGRVGTRKGYQLVTQEADQKPIIGLTRFQDLTGAEEYISWDGQGFFYSGFDLQPINTTPYSTGDWKAVTLNDHLFLFQKGQIPLVYSKETGSPILEPLDQHHTVHGTSSMIPKAGIALSAYGRVFVADTDASSTVVLFSSLLDGTDFGNTVPDPNEATTGVSGSTAGAINLAAMFTQGTDKITGLGAINGYLIVFCRNSIIVFGDTNEANNSITIDPLGLQLIEIIQGVGCIATDSIQNVGNDIYFLSDSGVKSLGRTIQEKSQPYQDISLNVKTDLINDVNRENTDLIRSVYSDCDNYYLLSFPSFNKVYCFDTRQPLENGAMRATTWSNVTHKDYCFDPTGNVYTAQTKGIAEIKDYTDDGEAIDMKYQSPYLDLGNPTALKVLKKLSAVLVGGSSQRATLTSSFDFSSRVDPYEIILQEGAAARYGISRYGLSTYSSGVVAQAPTVSACGSGNLIQIGFQASVKDTPTSIQKLDIFLKQGKTI